MVDDGGIVDIRVGAARMEVDTQYREKQKGRRFSVIDIDGAALLLSEVDDVVVR